MGGHAQQIVKVNAYVDQGLRGFIGAIARFPLMCTYESCQGDDGPCGMASIWMSSEEGTEYIVDFAMRILGSIADNHYHHGVDVALHHCSSSSPPSIHLTIPHDRILEWQRALEEAAHREFEV